MTKDLGPEERLLRLIKGQHKIQPTLEQPVQIPAAQTAPQQKPETEKRLPVVEKIPSVDSPSSFSKKIDPFKAAVIVLAVFFIGGIFYFVSEISRKEQPPIDVEKLIALGEKEKTQQTPVVAQETKPEGDTKTEEETPPPARELFGAPVTRETAQAMQQGPSISELAKDLALLGVITGGSPQAIIENKKTRQTYYLNEGEDILEFKIKKIDKATVILEHNGETIKLSL